MGSCLATVVHTRTEWRGITVPVLATGFFGVDDIKDQVIGLKPGL